MAATADSDSLKARFSEFKDAPDDLVTQIVSEATRRTDAKVWGEKTDDGIHYLAAHLLAMHPKSRKMANCKCAADGSTWYLRERRAMARSVASGFRLASAKG